jgi:hypothetical protein
VPGKEAGHLNTAGYIEIRYLGKTLQGHRIAWYLETGEDPGALHIDHINCIRHDNRFCNLRLATHLDNARNRKKRNYRTSSKYKGVSWYSRHQKWIATIRVSGKSIHLGYFDDELSAHAAYYLAAKEHFGEFARFE